MARLWMPMYWGDYRANTAHLSTVEHGAYLLLIAHYWEHGGLPQDEKSLRRITGMTGHQWGKSRDTLAAFFDEGWKHGRIDFELDKAGRIVGQRADAGSFGGRTRWGELTTGDVRSKRLSEARKKGTHTNREWAALMVICGSRCVKCGSEEKIVKDHITPIYQGGSDSIKNLQPLCSRCNLSKGPDVFDLRPQDWPERLANACQTSGKTPTYSQSPSQITSEIPSYSSPSAAIKKLNSVVSCETAAVKVPRNGTKSRDGRFIYFRRGTSEYDAYAADYRQGTGDDPHATSAGRWFKVLGEAV